MKYFQSVCNVLSFTVNIYYFYNAIFTVTILLHAMGPKLERNVRFPFYDIGQEELAESLNEKTHARN
jgi:hypothetical protein